MTTKIVLSPQFNIETMASYLTIGKKPFLI